MSIGFSFSRRILSASMVQCRASVLGVHDMVSESSFSIGTWDCWDLN